jgi:SAM-dependent methyltransferase
MQFEDYRDLAAVEDSMWYFHALHQRMLLPLQPLIGRQATILDAGCGTGGLIRAMRSREPLWSVSGVDVSPIACDFARQRTHVPILQGSVEALPFEDAQFDAVTNADVIYMVREPEQAIREWARVLRPGGTLAINTAAYQWMWSYHDDLIGTRHRFRRSELAGLLRRHGFEITLCSYAVLLVFPLIVARRKLFVPANPCSDVKPYPALIESLFGSLASLENGLLRRGIALPSGNSVFIAARRIT